MSQAPTVEHAHPEEHATSTGLDNRKVAMWAFIGSECLLFGALIATYLLYRNTGTRGPLPNDLYDIPFTSVSSFVLLMSSLAMVLALHAIQKGNHRSCRIWLVATALLGLTFLSGQVYEFTVFAHEGLKLSTNPAASAFYVLTGFHGTHVGIGILLLLSLWVMSMMGRLPTERSLTVELTGLYWHFVDIVWVIIFTVVYLIPH